MAESAERSGPWGAHRNRRGKAGKRGPGPARWFL